MEKFVLQSPKEKWFNAIYNQWHIFMYF